MQSAQLETSKTIGRAPPDAQWRTNATVSVAFVVPVLNEESAIRPFFDSVALALCDIPKARFEFVFVNDGSTDNTLGELQDVQAKGMAVKIVDLSRNFGKEAAMIAGMRATEADVVVPIDVDLQDPPEIVEQMLREWRQGYDVVLAHRQDRSADSWLKRRSAGWFYSLHNRISDTKIPPNVGDFRLMDRCVVDAIRSLPESRLFMKGLMAWAGHSTTMIEYDRGARQTGHSKFNGWKLWNFALEGITSFSTVPLRIWTYLGFTVALLSFLYGSYIAIRVLVSGVDTPGYASIFVAVTFLGGLQLIGIGILGEYLGRTYVEAKQRPAYVIRKIYDFQTPDSSDAPEN